MRASIRRMGNSSGLIIPKPLLTEIGVAAGSEISLTVDGGRIVIEPIIVEPPSRPPREGWDGDAREIAATGDDALVWPDLANADDASLEW